jgi:hypothetical protein
MLPNFNADRVNRALSYSGGLLAKPRQNYTSAGGSAARSLPPVALGASSAIPAHLAVDREQAYVALNNTSQNRFHVVRYQTVPWDAWVRPDDSVPRQTISGRSNQVFLSHFSQDQVDYHTASTTLSAETSKIKLDKIFTLLQVSGCT